METNQTKNKPQVILFDVYETLLDMSDVKRSVNRSLDSRNAYTLWFSLLLEYSFASNSLGRFQPFSYIARESLVLTARLMEKELNDRTTEQILLLMKQLPLHEGVPQLLSDLSEQGFRLAALTNSDSEIVTVRMERTGLISYFECLLCAEEIKVYKPALEVYKWASKKLNIPASDIMMVSAHGWDIAGASYTGMQTALIEHPAEPLHPFMPQPDIIVNDITELPVQLAKLR